eukprot:339005-Rhodomonas_salina.2
MASEYTFYFAPSSTWGDGRRTLTLWPTTFATGLRSDAVSARAADIGAPEGGDHAQQGHGECAAYRWSRGNFYVVVPLAVGSGTAGIDSDGRSWERPS